MDLPSTRELELEVLLREKDAQLAEVTDEIVALRRYLAKQPGPSTTDPITLPPAVFSVLLPHITNPANGSTSGSSTVTAALTQRARLLQEENEELYTLLKQSETTKLKEELRGLLALVDKLEAALKDSHQTITQLSKELEKTQEVLKSSPAQTRTRKRSESRSQTPRNSHNTLPHTESTNTNNKGHESASRPPPPTEPRAHKRPRLSETQQHQPSPPPPPTQSSNNNPASRSAPNNSHSLPQKPQTYHQKALHHHLPSPVETRGQHHQQHQRHSHSHSTPSGGGGGGGGDKRQRTNSSKMDVDNDERGASPMAATPTTANSAATSVQQQQQQQQQQSVNNNRDRDRNREREKNNRERESRGVKERDQRDGTRNTHISGAASSGANPRRNGHTGMGTSSRTGGGSGGNIHSHNGGGSLGRKGNDRNHSNSNSTTQGLDNANRTLQERLGL